MDELCLVSSRHDAWDSGQRVQSLFQQTRECCFSWSESPSAAIWQTPGMLFHLTSLPYRPDWWSASELVVLLEGPPVFTEQHWSSVVDHLPDPFYLSCSDDQTSSIYRWWRHLWSLEPSMLHRFFCTLAHWICSLIQSCLGGLPTIPWTSCLGLCSDIHCLLWEVI